MNHSGSSQCCSCYSNCRGFVRDWYATWIDLYTAAPPNTKHELSAEKEHTVSETNYAATFARDTITAVNSTEDKANTHFTVLSQMLWFKVMFSPLLPLWSFAAVNTLTNTSYCFKAASCVTRAQSQPTSATKPNLVEFPSPVKWHNTLYFGVT